jgi:hypothetical protein
MKFVVPFLLLLSCCLFAEEPSKQWVIVVNEKSELSTMSKVALYKIFSCTDSKYNAVFLNVEDDTVRPVYESFLQFALDDKEINFVKFKSKNLTRIRKREPLIIKFYDTEEDILKKVAEDERSVGVVTTTKLPKGVKVCEVKE